MSEQMNKPKRRPKAATHHPWQLATHDPWPQVVMREMDDGEVRRFISPKVLAPRRWTTEGTLANQRSQGKGTPYYRFGTKILYDLADVEAEEEAARVETSK